MNIDTLLSLKLVVIAKKERPASNEGITEWNDHTGHQTVYRTR